MWPYPFAYILALKVQLFFSEQESQHTVIPCIWSWRWNFDNGNPGGRQRLGVSYHNFGGFKAHFIRISKKVLMGNQAKSAQASEETWRNLIIAAKTNAASLLVLSSYIDKICHEIPVIFHMTPTYSNIFHVRHFFLHRCSFSAEETAASSITWTTESPNLKKGSDVGSTQDGVADGLEFLIRIFTRSHGFVQKFVIEVTLRK